MAHGASFEQVVYKYFFWKTIAFDHCSVCVFNFFLSLRSPRPSVGAR